MFLLVTLAGLYFGIRHHGSWLAFTLGTLSALLTFAFVVVAFNKLLAVVGITGLILSTLLNVWLRMRQEEVKAKHLNK